MLQAWVSRLEPSAPPLTMMQGDPLDTSVLLWTRAYPQGSGPDQSVPACVQYQVYDNEQLKGNVTAKGSAFTSREVDFTVKVEVKGLQADTWYWYIFNDCTNSSTVSPKGRTRTLSNPNTPATEVNGGKPLTLAVFSCSNFDSGYFNAYGYAAKQTNPDLMVHLGDYIYEYAEGKYGNGASINRTVSNRELATLADYRTRLAVYRTDESLLYSHQNFPWVLVWDDHEVADNTWKAGSADSNDTPEGCKLAPSGICFSERKLSAIRAYHEWIPIRQVALDDKLRIWRNFQVGKLLDLTMLDTRHYDRDITDVYYNTAYVDSIHKQENRSIMGLKQEAWLYDQLLSSKSRGAIWRVIGQQVVFTQVKRPLPLGKVELDSWDGYTANRRRILDLLYKAKIDNTVILSGDSHANWVSDLAYPDDKTSYNPRTGQGAIGVEFAGTAVSSPSPYGDWLPSLIADGISKLFVVTNLDLQWSEGHRRGFFTLSVAEKNLTAKYYAMKDVKSANLNAFMSAEFHVTAGANRLTRPVAGGSVAAGALKGKWF
ncbi:hypothetical protein FS749_007928 [Ceratobasidium sp. UAMH 11750]|nr:hypothetical protein FS749_007928 [Ceratobasidium sp. UAMH 11750]